MATDNVAPVADDDFDVTADLAAAFDAAENDTPALEPEPAGETAEQAAERVRDEKGRFAAKTETDEKAVEAKTSVAKTDEIAPVAKTSVSPVADPLAQPAEPVKPPPGFSPTAKVVWDKETLSKEEWEAVKRDIAKRNDEVGKGFEKLAEYKPIERFAEMARQSGTTLHRALENYVGIEQDLRRDFIGGISRICQNQGISPLALANQILARNGVAPSEGQAGNQPQAHQPAGVDLSPITQELNALKSYVQQQQTTAVQSEIQRFASDPKHTFFENVKADMGRLMNSGYAEGLDDAYEKACWANPEIRNLLIKQQQTAPTDPSAKVAAATQARAASKSITGSPIPNASAKGPDISIEDEIRQLMDASV
jgi:hypothetical protein